MWLVCLSERGVQLQGVFQLNIMAGSPALPTTYFKTEQVTRNDLFFSSFEKDYSIYLLKRQ